MIIRKFEINQHETSENNEPIGINGFNIHLIAVGTKELLKLIESMGDL